MTRMPEASPLRLLAQDAGDLEIISAAVQDAVGKVGDIEYEPRARTLTLSFNRYRWEAGARQRVKSALQFGGVLRVQARGIGKGSPDVVLQVLAVSFQPGESPGGVITISFAAGADLRLEVECVEGVLADLSAPWP